MLNVGIVGVGKMGLSHLSLLGAHPEVQVAGVCDSTKYVLDVLGKYSGFPTYTDYSQMLREADLDAVLIATPTRGHAPMIESALTAGLHVFSEKPLCLDPSDSRRLAAEANRRGLVTQVGYHNRYVGAFAEVKRLLESEAIGKVTHVLAEAYGPVVLAEQGRTWRSSRAEGGGCLYDYAAHPIDLLSWYFGRPQAVGGTLLGRPFSRSTEDEVSATLFYPEGTSAQLSVSWSDESQRKMSTKITIWGTKGRIFADRQEVQVYLRDTASPVEGYAQGWNTKYTTELTSPTWFYLRGEEYSAQIDDFVRRIGAGQLDGLNTFSTAAVADEVIKLLVLDAEKGPSTAMDELPASTSQAGTVVAATQRRSRWRRWLRPRGTRTLRRSRPEARKRVA